MAYLKLNSQDSGTVGSVPCGLWVLTEGAWDGHVVLKGPSSILRITGSDAPQYWNDVALKKYAVRPMRPGESITCVE